MRLLPGEPRRRRALLTAALALCASYSVHYYVYAPAKRDADEVRARLEELRAMNRRADAATAEGAASLDRRLALYERHISDLEKLIPANEEVPALLAAVSAEERLASVEVVAMRPEPPEPGEYYQRRSYELRVEGGYHQVGAFMTAIASLERIVAPTDVSIAPAGSPVPGSGPGLVVANFRIRTYSRGG